MRGSRRWLFRGFAVLALGVCALLGANLWVLAGARDHVYPDVESVPPRSVALVLGAHVSGEVPSDVLEDRLALARDLYRARKVGRVLVSGDHGQSSYDEVNAMRAWLVREGIPSDDVFMDHAGFRTLDSAERAASVFEVQDAILCTQRFHLARAVFLARRAGIDALGVPADRRRYRGWARNELREALARGMAVVDSAVLGREPRHLGASIPITGPATATHDSGTSRLAGTGL